MATLRIGTSPSTLVDMPEPAHADGFRVTYQDIDAANAGRSANGTMIRDRVCGGATAKRKIELRWAYPTPEQAKTILTAIKNTYFYVEYPDAFEGGRRVALFYAGDRAAPVYWNLATGDLRYSDLTVNLIEK